MGSEGRGLPSSSSAIFQGDPGPRLTAALDHGLPAMHTHPQLTNIAQVHPNDLGTESTAPTSLVRRPRKGTHLSSPLRLQEETENAAGQIGRLDGRTDFLTVTGVRSMR